MKTKILVAVFSLTVIAQIWVPATMIFSSEKTLVSGRTFRFRTAPVDPYDAFRGKYVALDFTASRVDTAVYETFLRKGGTALSKGKTVYVIIKEDNNGFARVNGLSRVKPENGYFLRSRVRSVTSGSLRLTFPFNKFFLEEGMAEKAETLYRQQNRAKKKDCYAVVKIAANGNAVMDDLVLGGIPVREAVR